VQDEPETGDESRATAPPHVGANSG
jgi:hypothetical protein